MLKHLFSIFLRNISKHKLSALINIFGLSAGMICCILIFLYVQYELSYDRFHEKNERIFRLVLERKGIDNVRSDVTAPPILAPTLKNYFPRIINTVRFLNMDNPAPLISSVEKRFQEKQIYFVDKEVFSVFTIPFVSGNSSEALLKPNSVVITEDIAKKYFGEQTPLGKILSLNDSLFLEITGVVKNMPSNSTLKFGFLVSFSTLYNWLGKDFINSWQNNMCQTYLLLQTEHDTEALTNELPRFISRHFDESNSLRKIYLQPLNRIHLYSFKDFNLTSGGDINYALSLTAIAVLVLIIACFNYINLSSAKFIYRLKEIRLKKIMGATYKQIAFQFFMEGLLLMFIIFLISLFIVFLILPYFSNVIGRNLSLNSINDWKLLIIPLLIIMIAGLLAGVYPVYFIFFSKQVTSLQNNRIAGYGRTYLKKMLVIIQFSLTTILFTGTWIVFDQINFMQNSRLGFEGDNVAVVPIRNEKLRLNRDALKEQLLKQTGVLGVGSAALLPGGPVGKTQFHIDGPGHSGTMSMLWVDKDFISTLGIRLMAGRDFSGEFTSDAAEAFIINEEALSQLGFKTPNEAIGKTLDLTGRKKGTVIGVVKNFHLTSLKRRIEPLVMYLWPWSNYVLIRLDGGKIPETIAGIKNIYATFDPGSLTDIRFLSDNFAAFYESEKQFEKVAFIFTLLSILVACLGLFNLSKFTSERRVKEIGIRRVLGASVFGLIGIQLKEYLALLFLSNAVAIPVTSFIMTKWLQNFAYRIDINSTTFIICCLMSLLTAFLTVIYHSAKAALCNPVDSIKYE